ncbi:hypothetical protein HK100_009119 [Physocladia obscura]|uniref:Uncharacterized protein n=1 Tax=Physocladia obscura TaxID=109957 RepID=A0AAD5T9A1_9FUNG|nr:hypothetical protein HK100_009119 [Physocladia obscura]
MPFERLVAGLKSVIAPSSAKNSRRTRGNRDDSTKTLIVYDERSQAVVANVVSKHPELLHQNHAQVGKEDTRLETRNESNTIPNNAAIAHEEFHLEVDSNEDRVHFHELTASNKWVLCDTGLNFQRPQDSKCNNYSAVSHVWGNAGSLVAGSGCAWVVRLNNDPRKFRVLQNLLSKHGNGKSLWLDVKDQPQNDASGMCVNPKLQADQVAVMAFVYYSAQHTYILIEQDLSSKKALIEHSIKKQIYPSNAVYPESPLAILLYIQQHKGEDLAVLISPEQLVYTLKKRIYWLTHILPVSQQLHLVTSNGSVEIFNNDTLLKYKLSTGSTIRLDEIEQNPRGDDPNESNEINYRITGLSRYISVLLFDFLSGTEFRNRVWTLQEEVLSKSKSVIFWTKEGSVDFFSPEWLASLFKENLSIWSSDLQDSNSELSSAIKLIFGIQGRYKLLNELAISESFKFDNAFVHEKESIDWLHADKSEMSSGDFNSFILTLPQRIHFNENLSGTFVGVQHPDTVWENYFSIYCRSSWLLKDQVFAYNKLLGIPIESNYNNASLDEIFGEWNCGLIAKGYVGFGWRSITGQRYSREREMEILKNTKKEEFETEFKNLESQFYSSKIFALETFTSASDYATAKIKSLKQAGDLSAADEKDKTKEFKLEFNKAKSIFDSKNPQIYFEYKGFDISRDYAEAKFEEFEKKFKMNQVVSMSWSMDSNWLHDRQNGTETGQMDIKLLEHRYAEMSSCRLEWGLGGKLILNPADHKSCLSLKDPASVSAIGPFCRTEIFNDVIGTFYLRELYAEFCPAGHLRKYGLSVARIDKYTENEHAGEEGAKKVFKQDADVIETLYFIVGKNGKVIRVCFVEEFELHCGIELYLGASEADNESGLGSWKSKFKSAQGISTFLLLAKSDAGTYAPIAMSSIETPFELVLSAETKIELAEDFGM